MRKHTNGDGGVVIAVEDAGLKTCTVTVQAMKVNNRQVTLSLFRQLIEEDVIGGEPRPEGLVS
jgi:hypothetical protein